MVCRQEKNLCTLFQNTSREAKPKKNHRLPSWRKPIKYHRVSRDTKTHEGLAVSARSALPLATAGTQEPEFKPRLLERRSSGAASGE